MAQCCLSAGKISALSAGKISAIAWDREAPAASAGPTGAIALVFVDQTVTMGNDAPANSASMVKVMLHKVRRALAGFRI